MKHYKVAKISHNNMILVDYNLLDGFKVMPKNNLRYPGIEVNSIVMVKPSFIEKIIKKKVKIKLDYYLKYLISLADDDDSEDPKKALNSLSRYKDIVEYKYRKFLDDKYINILLKKIDLLEKELKSKIVYQKLREDKVTYHEEETRRRSR